MCAMWINCDELDLTAQIFTICNKTIFEIISSISMWQHVINCIYSPNRLFCKSQTTICILEVKGWNCIWLTFFLHP
jgi:hypothetical protein